jgi:hypothetical protein
LLNCTVLLNFGRSEAIDVSAPNSIEITASAPKPVSTNSSRSLRTRGRGGRGERPRRRRLRPRMPRSCGAMTIGAGSPSPSLWV